MKCEVRGSCRNEAELWIHLNGRPKRSCVACSTRAIGDLQVVESHWNAPLDQPCPSPAHRALTPAEREAIIKAEDRNGGKAIPLPPPTEEMEACLPSSDSPPTAGLPQETDMGSKPLTLTLRPDADAHPELCRVAECPWGDRPPVGLVRGLCPADTATLRKQGLYHAFALPPVRRKRSPPDAEVTPDGEVTTLSEGDALLPHGAAAPPVVVPAVEHSPAEAPVRLSDLTVEEMGAMLGLECIDLDGWWQWRDAEGVVAEPIDGDTDGTWRSWPVGASCDAGQDHPTERAAMERLYRLALREGRALRPIPVRTVQADPPPAPPPPAVDERLTRLNGEIAQWRDLADRQRDALEAIAEAMDCEHDPDKPIGPQLVQRAQNLLNLNKEWEAMRDGARAAYDRSQNELLALASEVKHLSQRAELAEDAATERRYELDTALQTYADLRAKLCQIFGEDPAELTDQGIVSEVTMMRECWGRTEMDYQGFRAAVAKLVGVDDGDGANEDLLLDDLRAALEQPVSYGPFRVDSAVCVPSGRNQATLTWAQGDARLLPVGSLVRLTVVEVLGG